MKLKVTHICISDNDRGYVSAENVILNLLNQTDRNGSNTCKL